MLRIDQLRLHPGQQETLLRARCAKLLRVAPADITACTVLRKAIDAREDLTLVYTVSVSVKNEAQVLRRCRDKRVSVYKQEVYFLPPPVTAPASQEYLKWGSSRYMMSPMISAQPPFKTMVGRTQAAYPAMKSESPAPMAPASIPLRVPNRQTVRMIMQSPR